MGQSIFMQRITKFLNTDTPVRWLFNGDSITHGAKHTHGCRDYPELFGERVRYLLARKDDLVIKSAISGNTTRHLLDTFEHRVAVIQPHVVFYMIGMNDCSPKNEISVEEYEQNIDLLGQKTEKLGALPVFQTCNPIVSPGEDQQVRGLRLNKYLNALRQKAVSRNWPLIDHHQFWEKQEEAVLFGWMNDTVHPNAYGHRAFYRYLSQCLGIGEPVSPHENLFVPGLQGV